MVETSASKWRRSIENVWVRRSRCSEGVMALTEEGSKESKHGNRNCVARNCAAISDFGRATLPRSRNVPNWSRLGEGSLAQRSKPVKPPDFATQVAKFGPGCGAVSTRNGGGDDRTQRRCLVQHRPLACAVRRLAARNEQGIADPFGRPIARCSHSPSGRRVADRHGRVARATHLRMHAAQRSIVFFRGAGRRFSPT